MLGSRNRERERELAERPVEEAGGGVSEGFEQSEEELREQAENFEQGRNPEYDAGEAEVGPPRGVYGEADRELSSEHPGGEEVDADELDDSDDISEEA